MHINNQKALEELNNNWQVLSEAIQIVMKLEGIDDAYEYIKDFTRGSEMDKESYKQLINNLPISLKSKNKLLALLRKTILDKPIYYSFNFFIL